MALLKYPAGAKPLAELRQQVHTLSTNAGMSMLYEIQKAAGILEKLLKDFDERPALITHSSLRTVAQVTGVLPQLFSEAATIRSDRNSALPRALAIDDEDISRRVVGHALERAGYQVIQLTDPACALDVLTQNDFDLIVSDIKMLGIDGFQLFTKFRSLPRHRSTPVLFLSSAAERESEVIAGLRNNSDFIAKPFFQAEFEAKLITLIVKERLSIRTDAPVEEGMELVV